MIITTTTTAIIITTTTATIIIIIIIILLQRPTAMQVRSSVRLMPQNQPSGRGLLPSPTAWLSHQHPAAMLADVSRHILGRTEGCVLGFNNNNNNNNYNNNNNNNHTKRRNSRFFTISSLRRELSPTCKLLWPRRNCVQSRCSTQSAYHVQYIMCHVVR